MNDDVSQAAQHRPARGLRSPAAALFAPRVRVGNRHQVNLGLIPELAAERFGRIPIHLDKPLDVDPRGRRDIDYVELALLVEQLSGALAAAGVRPRDRVAVVKTPNYDTLPLAAAAARLGAIPVLITPRLSPLGEALQVLLARLGSPFLVTDSATMAAAGLGPERLDELTAGVIGDVEGGTPLQSLYGAPAPPPAPRAGGEPMFVTHTGGTTGIPKLIEQSVAGAAHICGIETRRTPWSLSPGETFAPCISYVHARSIYGFMGTLCRGARIVTLTDTGEDNVVAAFSAHRPTVIESHPNTFLRWERIGDHPSEPFADVRMFFSTFDAAHPRTIRRMLSASRRRAPFYIQCYGMSEVGPVTIRTYSRRAASRLGRSTNARDVGWPIPGAVDARIVDPDSGRPLPPGRMGMIQARTRGRCRSFVEQPEKYRAREHGEWFDTGDYGRMTRLRRLEVLDREVDHVAGVDSCIAIEDALLDRLPQLAEAVVVSDGHGGVVPIVCTIDDEPLDRAAWDAAIAGLPSLAEPMHVRVAELPRTETLKARRFLLRARLDSPELASEPTIALRDGA